LLHRPTQIILSVFLLASPTEQFVRFHSWSVVR